MSTKPHTRRNSACSSDLFRFSVIIPGNTPTSKHSCTALHTETDKRSLGVKLIIAIGEWISYGLQDKPSLQAGHHGSIQGHMRKIRIMDCTRIACWEVESVRFSFEMTCIVQSHIRREMMRKWGVSIKVPVMRLTSTGQASDVARFKKRMKRFRQMQARLDGGRPTLPSIVVAIQGPERGSTRWETSGCRIYDGSHTKISSSDSSLI